MSLALLAQISTWGIGQWAIAIVVILGIIAIVYIVAQWMGIPIPPPLVKIIGIVLIVVIGVVAIRFLVTML